MRYCFSLIVFLISARGDNKFMVYGLRIVGRKPRPGSIVDLPAKKWSDPARIMLVRGITLKLLYVARWYGRGCLS